MLVWILAAALIAEALVIATLVIGILETRWQDRQTRPALPADASKEMRYPPIDLSPVAPVLLTMPDGSIRDQWYTLWPSLPE